MGNFAKFGLLKDWCENSQMFKMWDKSPHDIENPESLSWHHMPKKTSKNCDRSLNRILNSTLLKHGTSGTSQEQARNRSVTSGTSQEQASNRPVTSGTSQE